MEIIGRNRCFDGEQHRYEHQSEVLRCTMRFSVYLPDHAEEQAVPVLYWLSGLTCTDENFVTKAGAQQYASQHGIALVAPDTSPRGDEVADDPEGSYDFGLGAGFYVNATQPPWDEHYHMYDYVVSELPGLIRQHLNIDTETAGISGHSMGGHGALTIALKNPERYRSVSAFAPICAPSRCPWGEKALGRYPGEDRELWHDYDATSLINSAEHHLPVLIDQGEADEFLTEQLKPELLEEAAEKAGYPVTVRRQPGFDHSYFFIASSIGEHIAFHAQHLKGE